VSLWGKNPVVHPPRPQDVVYSIEPWTKKGRLEHRSHRAAPGALRGVFIVPVGELERWLAHLGVKGAKHAWLSQIFERMGSNPADSGYVRPTEGDVWAFLRRIGKWLRDPNRKGVPV
jgi:hypothetical protein